MFAQNWNPIELFKNGDISTMLEGQYWNYNKNKSYKKGQITVGLVKIKLIVGLKALKQPLQFYIAAAFFFQFTAAAYFI